MSESKSPQNSSSERPKSKQEERFERQAKALRDNLRRRKMQNRSRGEEGDSPAKKG